MDKWEALKKLAKDNNAFVQVQVSPRKYIVINPYVTTGIKRNGEHGKEEFRLDCEGRLMFGPESYDKCQKYMEDHSVGIPPELV